MCILLYYWANKMMMMMMNCFLVSASEATATWRFTNFVLHCTVWPASQLSAEDSDVHHSHTGPRPIFTKTWITSNVASRYASYCNNLLDFGAINCRLTYLQYIATFICAERGYYRLIRRSTRVHQNKHCTTHTHTHTQSYIVIYI